MLREGFFNPLVVPSSNWWLVGMLDDLNSGDAIKAVARYRGIYLPPPPVAPNPP